MEIKALALESVVRLINVQKFGWTLISGYREANREAGR